MLKSSQKTAKMERFGDNINSGMREDRKPKGFVLAGEDYLRQVGVRVAEFSQNFRPRLERAVDVNQENPRAGNR
jgi:hypothetical protein